MQNAFLSFIHAAFGDDHETMAQLQLIAGRLFLPQCNKAEQVYVHVGVNSGKLKQVMLEALGQVFHGMTLLEPENDVQGTAQYLRLSRPRVCLRLEPGGTATRSVCSDGYSHEGEIVFRPTSVTAITHETQHTFQPERLGGFVHVQISDAFLKHMSALTYTQTHVSLPTGAEIFKALDEASARRILVVDWTPADLSAHAARQEGVGAAISAQQLAQDPDFIIWLAEGLRRAQIIDKVQPTIDRPADIVLSDELSE